MQKFDFCLQDFENLLLQSTEQNSKILHTNNPLVCVFKVCSNGGVTFIIGEIIEQETFLNKEKSGQLIFEKWCSESLQYV